MNVEGNVEDKEQQPVIGGLLILISLLGIAGNIATLILVRENQTFRALRQGKLFLGNLALADLINSALGLVSGLGCIDKAIVMAGKKQLCYLTAHAKMSLPFLAIFSMTLLTMNRYYVIVNLQKAERLFKGRQPWIYILTVWIFPILMSCIPIAVNSGAYPALKVEKGLCSIRNETTKWYTGLIGALTTIALLAMFYQNFKIQLEIQKCHRRIRDENTDQNSVFIQRNKRITQIVLVAFVSHIICYTPILIVGASLWNKRQTTGLYPYAYLFLHTNYANNVFIYIVMDKGYRRTLKKLFC